MKKWWSDRDNLQDKMAETLQEADSTQKNLKKAQEVHRELANRVTDLVNCAPQRNQEEKAYKKDLIDLPSELP